MPDVAKAGFVTGFDQQGVYQTCPAVPHLTIRRVCLHMMKFRALKGACLAQLCTDMCPSHIVVSMRGGVGYEFVSAATGAAARLWASTMTKVSPSSRISEKTLLYQMPVSPIA